MTPRMEPDGTVSLVNVGTVENPVLESTRKLNHALVEMGQSMGVAAEDMGAFLTQWKATAEELATAPKRELLWRLNQQVQMIDPGEPVNWPGLRGFR